MTYVSYDCPDSLRSDNPINLKHLTNRSVKKMSQVVGHKRELKLRMITLNLSAIITSWVVISRR